MTKKDFEAIARIIREGSNVSTETLDSGQRFAFHEGKRAAVAAIANAYADHAQAVNPRFDRDRFMRASGLEG